MISPSRLVRSQLLARLADATNGFNARYAAALATTEYSGAPAMSFDFGATSKNFCQGRVALDEVIGAGTFMLPMMAMYGMGGANTNLQKFQRFAGLVRMGVDVHLSDKIYKRSLALNDFEVWADAVEETMVNVVNAKEVQNWPYSVVYNGQIGYERRPVAKAGTSWLQTIFFQLTFEVVVT